MSLLMDALKKAELAKRQGHAEDTGDAKAPEGAGELSLKPLTEPNFTDSTLDLPEVGVPTPAVPSQSSQFEELDASDLQQGPEKIDVRRQFAAIELQIGDIGQHQRVSRVRAGRSRQRDAQPD